jgi:uncharacterized coiled-coil protein SlyX
VVTANIASWFVQQDQQSDTEQLAEQLRQITAKLERLEGQLVGSRAEAAAGRDDGR